MVTKSFVFNNILLNSSIGILNNEINYKQPIQIYLKIFLHSPLSNNIYINKIFDYRKVYILVLHECLKSHINLIEDLTNNISKSLIKSFIFVNSIYLKLSKLISFFNCKSVSIEFRKKNNYFI